MPLLVQSPATKKDDLRATGTANYHTIREPVGYKGKCIIQDFRGNLTGLGEEYTCLKTVQSSTRMIYANILKRLPKP